MKLTEYPGGQFARPRGEVGKAAAFLMSRMNRQQYRAVGEGLSRCFAGRKLLGVG